jgi:hypothetical protein
MRIEIKLIVVFLAALAASAAHAQIYKWVDERGVVNYSNQPPSDRGVADRFETVEKGISVYMPDANLMRAVKDARRGIGWIEDTATTGYPHTAAPRAQQYAAPATTVGTPDSCAGSRAIYCYSGHYPHFYDGAPVLLHRQPRQIPQIQLTPGTTAGHVAGTEGHIPGNSAAASGRFPPRSSEWFSTTGGFTRR